MNLFEIGLLDAVQNIRTPFGDWFMPLVTKLGDGGIFWIIATVALLIFPRTRRLGFACAVALVIDVALCNGLIKNLVARTRPYVVNPDIVLLIPKPGEFSFPSGHAAASFTFVGALYFSKSRLWIPSCVLAAVVAFSRIYLYVHYPTDILGGMVFGVLFGFLGALLARKLTELIKRKRGASDGPDAE